MNQNLMGKGLEGGLNYVILMFFFQFGMLIIIYPTDVSLFVVEQKFYEGLRGKVEARYFVVLLGDSDVI